MFSWRKQLLDGCVIPAHPLALTADRRLDENYQAGLSRYYLDSGAGGLAVGVHTTQFAIRDHGLLEPVLRLAADAARGREALLVAGACGPTAQALREAELSAKLGYHCILRSLSAFKTATTAEMLADLSSLSSVLPVFGFYLQPAVGGRLLPYDFWRQAAELPNLIAIKVAPFNRYQTLDVIRAVAASGRAREISLYTGNDDTIVADLLTEYEFSGQKLRFVGGLLGQWAVGTKSAADLLKRIHQGERDLLTLAAHLTDLNAALFDAANSFHGCIAGIHEVLVRQGLMAGRWCLDPAEDLSPGQLEEIERVMTAYPYLLL